MKNDQKVDSNDAPLQEMNRRKSLECEAHVLIVGGEARSVDRLSPDTQERIRRGLERHLNPAKVDIIDGRFHVMLDEHHFSTLTAADLIHPPLQHVAPAPTTFDTPGMEEKLVLVRPAPSILWADEPHHLP